MAKNPFMLYGAKGKVGNLVAQKTRKGDTMVREHVIPANPKTVAQQAQRLIFATVASAAAILKPIINHSFQGMAYGSDSVDYFRKINLKALRALAAQDVAEATSAVDSHVFMTAQGLSALVPNPYIVSDGSLTNPKITVSRNTTGAQFEGQLKITTPETSSFPLSKDDQDRLYTTVGDLTKAIFGVSQPREELALMCLCRGGEGYRYVFNNDADVAGWVIPYVVPSTMRAVLSSTQLDNKIILTEANSTTVIASAIEELTNVAEAAFGGSDTDNTFLSILNSLVAGAFSGIQSDMEIQNQSIALRLGSVNIDSYVQGASNTGHVYAAAIIRSQLDGATWKRNRAQLVTAIPVGGSYKNFGLDWNSAVQTFGQSVQPVTTGGRFLNTGGIPDLVGESFS